jgi:hypothetical protein
LASSSFLYAFSIFTKKVLYSGHQAFTSIAEGVSRFASGPV